MSQQIKQKNIGRTLEILGGKKREGKGKERLIKRRYIIRHPEDEVFKNIHKTQ